LVLDSWFLNEDFVLWSYLLSRELTDSVSVPGKCLIAAETFDTKTMWSGSSLRYSVVRNFRCLLGPFGFRCASHKEFLYININKKPQLLVFCKTTWLISCRLLKISQSHIIHTSWAISVKLVAY
jgi:hypothetical protein